MFRDTLGCEQRSDRVLLKRKLKMCGVPRVRFHEIILLTEIKKDDVAQKPRMQAGKCTCDRNKWAVVEEI